MTWPTSERDQILQHVSNFRAHQEKMAREREDYYLQMKAKMPAGIDPDSASSPKSGTMPRGPRLVPSIAIDAICTLRSLVNYLKINTKLVLD
jgi:hypothetical protein